MIEGQRPLADLRLSKLANDVGMTSGSGRTRGRRGLRRLAAIEIFSQSPDHAVERGSAQRSGLRLRAGLGHAANGPVDGMADNACQEGLSQLLKQPGIARCPTHNQTPRGRGRPSGFEQCLLKLSLGVTARHSVAPTTVIERVDSGLVWLMNV